MKSKNLKGSKSGKCWTNNDPWTISSVDCLTIKIWMKVDRSPLSEWHTGDPFFSRTIQESKRRWRWLDTGPFPQSLFVLHCASTAWVLARVTRRSRKECLRLGGRPSAIRDRSLAAVFWVFFYFFSCFSLLPILLFGGDCYRRTCPVKPADRVSPEYHFSNFFHFQKKETTLLAWMSFFVLAVEWISMIPFITSQPIDR